MLACLQRDLETRPRTFEKKEIETMPTYEYQPGACGHRDAPCKMDLRQSPAAMGQRIRPQSRPGGVRWMIMGGRPMDDSLCFE